MAIRLVKASLAITSFVFIAAISPCAALGAQGGLDVQSELSMPGVKLVVVEFYATWCKPCMEAIPKWKALHDKYKSSGLRFIVVSAEGNVSGDSTCSSPPDWTPDKSICDTSGEIQKMLDVKALPQSFLYSWEGKISITSHGVEPIEKAIVDYFKNTHLKMVVDQPEVFGDKFAVSGNPAWLRDYIIGKVKDYTKFDVVTGAETPLPQGKSETCGFNFPPNSTLRIKLQGDERGNRKLTVGLEKNGCILGSATEPYLGTGLNENIDSMNAAAELAVRKLMGSLVQVKPPKLVESWFHGKELVVVRFEPKPAGSVITIDGELRCKNTPCAITVTKGVHEVAIQAESYHSQTKTISFAGDDVVAWNLAPNFGLVDVITEPGSLDIELDGKIIGKSPIRKLRVPPGVHRVAVNRNDCVYEASETVSVDEGAELKVELKPVVREGGLAVYAEDEKGDQRRADVFVDDSKVGSAPGQFKLPVCSKNLRVVYQSDSYRSELRLVEKQVVEVRAKFVTKKEPPPPPASTRRMESKPRWAHIYGPTGTFTGLALLGLGGGFSYLASTSADSYKKATDPSKMASAKDDVNLYNGLAVGSYVTGGALMLSGIIIWALSDRIDGPSYSFAPFINGDVVGVGAAGEW